MFEWARRFMVLDSQKFTFAAVITGLIACSQDEKSLPKLQGTSIETSSESKRVYSPAAAEFGNTESEGDIQSKFSGQTGEAEPGRPPQNIAGAYLASICTPVEFAGTGYSGTLLGQSPLKIECEYEADGPSKLALNRIKRNALLEFFDGGSMEVELNFSELAPTLNKRTAHFSVAAKDWLRVQTITQTLEGFAPYSKEGSGASVAQIKSKVDLQGKLLGLQGFAYEVRTESLVKNVFPDLSMLASLGPVKLPPMQIGPFKESYDLDKIDPPPADFKWEDLGVPLRPLNQRPGHHLDRFEGGSEIASNNIDTFAVVLNGKIDIPEPNAGNMQSQSVTFRLQARTAARVTIDGVVVLQTEVPSISEILDLRNFLEATADCTRPCTERTNILKAQLKDVKGTLKLTPGPKNIKIEYLHNRTGWSPYLLLGWKLEREDKMSLVPFWALQQ